MISISPHSHINQYNSYFKAGSKQSVPNFANANTQSYMEQGDNLYNHGKFSDAIKAYNQALSMNPDNETINRKLGKAYHNIKDYSSAEKNFLIYIEKNPKDVDAWIELGEAQRQNGMYSKAKNSFEQAQSLDPNNDLARRSILETNNNILCCLSPQQAYTEKQAYATKNLQTALNMATNYMSPKYMQDLSDVVIEFGKTASMGGTANIAQYENAKKKITVSDTYKYASPQVIAAYIVHESVHAKDKDPYTSIREEQDAYEIATNFWIKNSNGVKDPEMDYAAELYQQSPQTLKDRVEEIYTLRDPDIAKTSPNHPPKKKFHFNWNKSKAATQPIKEYDTIA